MKPNLLLRLTNVYPRTADFHICMLVFRILLSLELIIVHGLKKVGIGVAEAEKVPNPYHLPEIINQFFATGANIICPLLIIIGAFTRFAVIPILIVTVSGYFVVHRTDNLHVRDIPFMYALSFIVVLLLGPGKYSIDYLIGKWFT